MSIWSELGIAPTADLAVIRRAYAAGLKCSRPEDDPVAFQRLRVTYEAACVEAESRSGSEQGSGTVEVGGESGESAVTDGPVAGLASSSVAEPGIVPAPGAADFAQRFLEEHVDATDRVAIAAALREMFKTPLLRLPPER